LAANFVFRLKALPVQFARGRFQLLLNAGKAGMV